MQQFPGSLSGADQTIGAHHFGKDQSRAEVLHDPAVGKIGDSGHGGENDIIVEYEMAYLHLFAQFLRILAWEHEKAREKGVGYCIQKCP